LKEAKLILVNGVSVIMLPEGTRSREGNLGEFKKGAFVMSVDLGMSLFLPCQRNVATEIAHE
jgi:1-acyl-sn-glycerol-3-phosphate acyltransferase